MVNKKGKTLTGYSYHTSAYSAKKKDELKKEFMEQGYNVRTKKKGKHYDIFTKRKKIIENKTGKSYKDKRLGKQRGRRFYRERRKNIIKKLKKTGR